MPMSSVLPVRYVRWKYNAAPWILISVLIGKYPRSGARKIKKNIFIRIIKKEIFSFILILYSFIDLILRFFDNKNTRVICRYFLSPSFSTLAFLNVGKLAEIRRKGKLDVGVVVGINHPRFFGLRDQLSLTNVRFC